MVALVRPDWDLQAHREYYKQYNRITKDNIQALENLNFLLQQHTSKSLKYYLLPFYSGSHSSMSIFDDPCRGIETLSH